MVIDRIDGLEKMCLGLIQNEYNTYRTIHVLPRRNIFQRDIFPRSANATMILFQDQYTNRY